MRNLVGVSLRQFQKGAAPCLPSHRIKSTLVALIQKKKKIEPFFPFSKKREKGYLFTIFAYVLNVSYTFKFKCAFGNQKCILKNIKEPIYYFQHPALF